VNHAVFFFFWQNFATWQKFTSEFNGKKNPKTSDLN
jgi:hypothetical protein